MDAVDRSTAALLLETLRGATGRADLEYAAPSDLFFRDPNDVKHVLKSMMGVRQGSVLGPVFFCAAMHPMLCEISRSNKDLRVYAYMDDVSLVGAPDACGKAFQFAQRHLNEMSVKINANKCEAIKACFMDSEKAIMRNMCGNDIAIVEANTHAIRLLGAYVGADSEVKSKLLTSVKKHDRLFSILRKLFGEDQLALLQHVLIPRVNFLLRTHRPDLMQDAAFYFEQNVSTALKQLANIDLDTDTRDLAALPTSWGGLGVTNVLKLSPIAYA